MKHAVLASLISMTVRVARDGEFIPPLGADQYVVRDGEIIVGNESILDALREAVPECEVA